MKVMSNSVTFTTVKDGNDAVVWRMVVTPNAIHKAANGVLTNDKVKIEVQKIVGNTIEATYTTSEELMEAYVVDIKYEEKSGGENYLSSREGELSIAVSEIETWVDNTFYLVDWNTEQVLDSFTLIVTSDGQRGSRGAVLRTTEWQKGMTYYQGAEDEAYLDVVILEGQYYQCSETHTSDEDNMPNFASTRYWQMASSFDIIATKVLLAKQAKIDLLQGNSIEVKDTDGNVMAGMTGGTGDENWNETGVVDTDPYPLWVGASYDERNKAPFRVASDGSAYIDGYIHAKGLYRGYAEVEPIETSLTINGIVVSIPHSNYHRYNPAMADYLLVRDIKYDDASGWELALEEGNWPDNTEGYNAENYGNVYIPKASSYKGKEVFIINTVGNIDNDLYVYAENSEDTTGDNAFYFPTNGLDSKGILISSATTFVRRLRLISDGSQWVVLESITDDFGNETANQVIGELQTSIVQLNNEIDEVDAKIGDINTILESIINS